MTFREVVKLENNKRKWIHKSKKLFKKYDKLDMFNYEWSYYYDSLDWFGEDVITVGIDDDVKRYYVADSKEGYRDLEYMLKLELEIRYKDKN